VALGFSIQRAASGMGSPFSSWITLRALRSHTSSELEKSLGSHVLSGLMNVRWATQLEVIIRLNSGFTTVS